MKKTLCIFLFFIGFSSFPQSAESLKTAAKKFHQAGYLMDFEAIASYSYPKMVEAVGNETFLENIEKQYENETFRLRLQLETVPFQYGEIQKIEGKLFCFITCLNPMRYFFEAKLTPDAAADNAAILKHTLNTNDVTFEPARNSFNVKRKTTYVAIADENTNNQWRFFNFDDKRQYIDFYTIFGESIKKELGL